MTVIELVVAHFTAQHTTPIDQTVAGKQDSAAAW